MPGLATHVLVNTITARGLKAGQYTPIFILGSLLPDVLTRVPSNTLGIIEKLFWEFAHIDVQALSIHLKWFMAPFHSPVILLLLCYLLAMVFPLKIRKPVFGWLYGGVLLHLGLDALQRHIGVAYYWLFPFSWHSYSHGLFWPETPLYGLPLLLAVWLGMEMMRFRRAWRAPNIPEKP